MSALPTARPFQIGTLGWTAGDLDDPEIARQWTMGRYEIIEGVLTDMAAAYFYHGNALSELMFELHAQFTRLRIEGKWSTELDIIIDDNRVVRADAVFMTASDQIAQIRAVADRGRPDPKRSRIYVPPTLVIESISPDHERHDRITKRRWYAEFGVPNYWIIDAYRKTLECLRLGAGGYEVDAAGAGNETVSPAAFAGVSISLGKLWSE